MKLVVGLGNPGEKYKNTRHNVGFLLVDRLEESRQKLDHLDEQVKYLKPDTFMNKSGSAVKKALKKFQVRNLEDLYVVHDDLDIKLGEYKISFGKGPRDHNGLKNIYEQVGTHDFWHVRVGVDNRVETGFPGTGEEYVLSSWRAQEREIVKGVIEKILKELNHVFD